MSYKNIRTLSNLAMLEFVAKKLGPLKKQVVFLGGCTTALFITDPLSPEVRATTDVDCIIDVITTRKYQQFISKLKKQGFKESMEEGVICRWHCEDIILDVMPTDEKILGFTNCWYKEAIKYAVPYPIADISIKAVTAPYFLATKLEAFQTRGNNDFLASHDFEDIITVIDGREELSAEIFQINPKLKKYLSNAFSKILENDQFHAALPGHFYNTSGNRSQIVLQRIKQIATIVEKEV